MLVLFDERDIYQFNRFAEPSGRFLCLPIFQLQAVPVPAISPPYDGSKQLAVQLSLSAGRQ